MGSGSNWLNVSSSGRALARSTAAIAEATGNGAIRSTMRDSSSPYGDCSSSRPAPIWRPMTRKAPPMRSNIRRRWTARRAAVFRSRIASHAIAAAPPTATAAAAPHRATIRARRRGNDSARIGGGGATPPAPERRRSGRRDRGPSVPGGAGSGLNVEPRSPLPVQPLPLFRVVADLVQRRRVVEPAVQHHHRDRFRVADVLERILVEHDEVRELPLLDRAELAVEADGLRAENRRAADRLQVRHAALLQHPQLPVGAEPLELAVRAELHAAARVENLLRAFRDQH